jgi:riboflavin kinase/FMN adenylyltransferase
MNESLTSTTGESRPIQIFRSVAEIPAHFGPAVAAIGNFDSVHLGHRANLSAVVAEARATGAQAIAVTFDPHPERFLRPAQAPKLLTPIPERLRLLAETGIDAALVLPFDAALASLSARNFVQNILVKALDIRSLHEGRNFRFGHGAEAGIAELESFGKEFGFAVHVHEAVKTHGLEVSSSAIRAFIAAGDMRRARWMLGRPFSVRSTQVRDRGVGAELLVPTINLAPYPELLPAFGVYVTRLTIAGHTFQAVTNVGNRPTFEGAGFSVESHILNFEPIAADAKSPIDLEFLLRLRGEVQWPSPEALKAQIFKDVARAKRYFRLLT